MFISSWSYEVSLLNSSNSLTISSNAFIKKIIICSRLYLCRLSFHRIFPLLSTSPFYISTIGFTILFLVPKTMLVVHSYILIIVVIIVMIFDIYQRFFDFVYSVICYEHLKFYVRFVLFVIKFVFTQGWFCSEEVV